MSKSQPMLRGFKTTFTIVGSAYVLLASSMLIRGEAVMRDFAVPESVVTAPAFEDFFSFFYQLMAVVGVLTVLFGHVTRDRASQVLVASVFAFTNVLITLRDLSTSDSSLGNRLYQGAATLIPVALDAAFALAFGVLALSGLRTRRSVSRP